MSSDDSLPEPPPKKLGFKAPVFEALNTSEGTAKDKHAPGVSEMLKTNVAISRAHEPPLNLERRPSRRKRDYFVGLLSVDLVLGVVLYLGRQDPRTYIWAFSGIVVWSVGLTWVMWALMDDY